MYITPSSGLSGINITYYSTMLQYTTPRLQAMNQTAHLYLLQSGFNLSQSVYNSI